ncbi:unnamed protein product [Caenorhabditis angaria]|uniref:Uncharacterized protein n=1 Tax=Caenorhabditis angaria TaxID=860376 RepID=A0A9P1I3X3_9PELO|nr:unnamed protein product [Caenorhabditis angaria]
MIFDGEAPETDDEEEIDEKAEVEKNLSKKPIVIDKTLQKHWNIIGNDLINFSSRRCANSNKQIQKISEQAANCFTNIINVKMAGTKTRK